MDENIVSEEFYGVKDIEITCKVFEEISNIKKALEDKGFSYVKEFILNDIYMSNEKTGEFVPKNNRITDTLIIRYINENDKKIISKKRNYDDTGFEISTYKTVLNIDDIEDAEKFFNTLGYKRYLNMIDKNYMYENEEYIAYIQEIENVGIFLEIEAKDKEKTAKSLVKYVKEMNLKIGTKFDVRKAEIMLWEKY